MSTLKYWVWLSSRGLRPVTQNKLLANFETPEKIFFTEKKDLKALGFLNSREIAALSDKTLAEARKVVDACAEKGYRIIAINDAAYPARLRNIFDPPAVLYVWGRLPLIDDEPVVSIVGTRNCTPYGIRSAEKIGYEFTKAGGLVASGLARGIDTAAVRGALRAGGLAIAVIGCGLDVFYPPENKPLFYDVADRGAVITEYAPGTKPEARHFPARNRIMSGIASGVLVIEAPMKSGALITAARALEQGRDVFALPGNADSEACEGSNALLKEGALLVTNGFEIAAEYRALFPERIRMDASEFKPLNEKLEAKLMQNNLPNDRKGGKTAKLAVDNDDGIEYIDLVKSFQNFSESELKIVSAITEDGTHVDEIAERSGLAQAEVLSLLTMLEINEIVLQSPGKRFSLNFKYKTPKSED
jgi:DNA processing protein